MTKAFSGKSFQPSAAANFVRDNKRLLDEFPTVRQEIDQSIASQQRLGAVETRAPRIAAAAAKSPAAKFAAASADKALDQIVAAARPQRAAANLRATALKDPTGAAIDGLKKAVSKALINRSALLLPHVDAAGAISQLRGTRLAETLDDEAFSAVAKQFLNSSELSRTRMVVREVQKLDLGRLMRSDPETLKRFEPNTVLETAVRILGANFGAMASGSAGGSFQAANIMSARFKSVLGALTNNQAQGLVLEALTADPDVMRMLLLDLRPPENLARIRRKLLPLLTGTATATATEDN
tara:strand:+ start:248 stop:1135 length:888 start_codon:yes stop_codon:yes gene_type:complete